MNRTPLLASCLLSLAAFGCAHPPVARDVTAHAGGASTTSPGTLPGASAAGGAEDSCSRDVDCPLDRLCVNARCVPVSEAVSACVGVRIHFAWNSSLIDEAERAGLERTARCLKADHALHVTISGNTDERGTVEYNMALGEQRALSVAKYLEALGVKEAQLRAVSYGEERPLCTSDDEACWSRNRRAEMSPAQARR